MDPVADPVAAFMVQAAWQSSLCLAIGIAAAPAGHRRPVRAHAVLLSSIIAALAAPLLSLLFSRLGLGLFESLPIQVNHAVRPPPAGATGGATAGFVLPELSVVLGIA